MDTAERFERAVKPTSKALNAVLSLVDRAKEANVPLKGSVWDMATGRVGGLEKFESSAREMERELDEWQEESERLERSLRELESAVEGAGERTDDLEEDGAGSEGVEYDRITKEFSEAMRSMEALDEKSARLERRLREASEKSHKIAGRAGGVPVLGGEMESRFETLGARLSETADDVARMNRKPADVIDVRPVPEEDA